VCTAMKRRVETLRFAVGLVSVVVLGLQPIPQCRAQSSVPWIPPPSYVTIFSPRITGGSVSVTVEVVLPDACRYVGDWGQPLLFGNTVYVDAQFWRKVNVYCAQVISTVATQYDLGPLPPGDYIFVFQVWDTTVKMRSFSVPAPEPEPGPELLSISASVESQVELCWNTATNAWYRVEYSSTRVTNQWTPLTSWFAGNGNAFCTNDNVVGQAQKFYRVARTSTQPPP
jgi:hypothetical protein